MTSEEILELANTLRLSLTHAECEAFCRDLASLEALCTPLLSVSETVSERYRAKGTDDLREDFVGESLPIEALQKMAPAWEDGYIPVPRTVEGGDAPCKTN